MKVERICEYCGKEFYVFPCRIKEGVRFCSRKCYELFNRGGNHFKWKPKIVRYCIMCGKRMELQECWMKKKGRGLFCSFKCRSKWRSENKSGENSWHWKGGLSFEPYGVEFNRKLKKQIRERDNYTCRECGITEEQLGYKLSTHHINYNKLDNRPENLISLCKSCHSQTNFKREDWIKYFQDKLNEGER